ncbi:MAG: hypothetical protein ED556_07215 [Winogradskyella sp.]|uniref:hypothetical protein n=1 Tax=Winogradskyella sp. TaxID=1883156 RepID=UPI000F3FC170|nr:hypothetical protein [Winogradskyella sp.]RNC87203.1 MAG: hypothetical protein ED556_07215 [Winogradskyella sp.]
MDLSITQVPLWLSITFIVSFVTIPIFLIANAANKAYYKGKTEAGIKIRNKILIFYWTYLVIVALVSLTGVFVQNTFPPLIVVTVALPLLAFYMLYVLRQSWFKTVLQNIRLDQLVYVHIFRFVGVFFFLVYAYGGLPKSFAYIGGAGDIITAILVIPVVMALRQKKSYAKGLTWVWNFIGLTDIISVLVTATIITNHAIENGLPGVQQFGTFPFSWIPAFAPATIIFFHFIIFKKLLEKNESL